MRARDTLTLAPPPLSPQERALYFTAAEAALADIGLTPDQNIVLDAATEGALSKAFSALPTDAAGRNRAWWLIRKAFPDRVGNQLAALLEQYSKYRDALFQTAGTAGDPAVELARLATAEALQMRYLGSSAAALFAQQNALQRYTLEVRRLELDAALDASARQARMLALQEQLERAMRVGR